ncbi:hypothetical protein TI39_contig438g00012 [Zymoseptoria brevis]|uniref:Xylanolytic transcriptional activator regulatory domain-containing protein n=1 Tax=Zymoseptoria brevis TaxID=1047168 RepID=A0A0F4GPE7_9PEZI|nr:hypothetical protein TI39_contig438g00012 [Zymoseptoria brevis]
MHDQFVDPTSGLSFLRRAQRRFSHNNRQRPNAGSVTQDAEQQPTMVAGDRPLLGDASQFQLPSHDFAVELLDLYFDVCVATYRILHRPSVDEWLRTMEDNAQRQRPLHTNLGRTKTAIMLGVFAVATFHHQKYRGNATNEDALLQSDGLMKEAVALTDAELGMPLLESVQARLVQVFYLLMTCRMNRAWYIFGNCLQIISALGMHRLGKKWRVGGVRGDYIQVECGKRTFWTAYILDKHLGVLLGRPPHFHDEDIVLDYPERVNDEDMTADGPRSDSSEDCHIDAFVCNAKLAQLVGRISRELYSAKSGSEMERLRSVARLHRDLESWHANLPPFLSAVKPSSLIRSFRRQSIALRIAYGHAVMHLNRPSLLKPDLNSRETTSSSGLHDSVDRCVLAARDVLKVVDGIAKDSALFHAFWWTHYVTFCALSVVYVWEIQQIRPAGKASMVDQDELSSLAEQCQKHLSEATVTNSPGRKYSIILEELWTEARQRKAHLDHVPGQRAGQNGPISTQDTMHNESGLLPNDMLNVGLDELYTCNMLDNWRATDWLDLDSSAFGPFDYNLSDEDWAPDV